MWILCPYIALLNNAKNMSANNMSAELVDLQNATTYEPVGCRVAIQVPVMHVNLPTLLSGLTTGALMHPYI